ncbi:hypothetical protein [Paenibacillus polymyxa]|uniref:hypothetical protein n=1 Tax=Paenibacillus polymyxa TaxID=1406 RepID=UPI003D26CAC7
MSELQSIVKTYKKNSLESSKPKLIEENIEKLMRNAQSIYWKVRELKNEQINPDFCNILTIARKYIELTEKDSNFPISLKKLESANDRSHIHSMGGGQKMKQDEFQERIVKELKNKPYVERVYLDLEENSYLILVNKDDPDLTLEIYELYWKLIDFADFEFEFNPVFLDQSNPIDLSKNMQLIIGG